MSEEPTIPSVSSTTPDRPTNKKPKSLLLVLASIIGAGLLFVVGVLVFALVVVPRMLPKATFQEAVERTITNSLTPETKKKDSIAGAPVTTINPFLKELQDRRLSYRWNKDEVYGYEVSYESQGSGKPFKVNGNCIYRIGAERTLQTENQSITGTAFAIAPGYLATCAHVAQAAMRIRVSFGEQQFAARIVDIDSKNDLAILAFEGQIEPLSLANSSSVEQAENILVIGFPLTDILGSGIKVSSGIVSAIDNSNGSRAIAIDGAINPGNSGGPVFNQKGQVVGVVSATLTGQRINPIGFASRIDELRSLMQKNNIESRSIDNESIIDSKEITKRATPSIGIVEVSGLADNRVRDIEFSTKFSGSLQSPVVTMNGVQQEGMIGKLSVSQLGDVKTSFNQQMPYLFASIPELLIQPFDMSAKDRWVVNQVYVLTQQQSRFGPSLPGLMRMPLREILLGRQSNQEAPKVQAESETRFDAIGTEGSQVRFKKTRLFKTLDGDQPSLEVKGQGTWIFDTEKGCPVSLEEELTVFQRSNGKVSEIPYMLKVTPIDPQLIQERERLAKEERERKAKEAETERTVPNPELIQELLSNAANENPTTRVPALTRLSKVAIVEAKRDDVLAAMRKLIGGKDAIVHQAAWASYAHWADTRCADELRRIVAKSRQHRSAALLILVEFGLEEDIPLVVEHLDELRFSSDEKLLKFGPSPFWTRWNRFKISGNFKNCSECWIRLELKRALSG